MYLFFVFSLRFVRGIVLFSWLLDFVCVIWFVVLCQVTVFCFDFWYLVDFDCFYCFGLLFVVDGSCIWVYILCKLDFNLVWIDLIPFCFVFGLLLFDFDLYCFTKRWLFGFWFDLFVYLICVLIGYLCLFCLFCDLVLLVALCLQGLIGWVIVFVFCDYKLTLWFNSRHLYIFEFDCFTIIDLWYIDDVIAHLFWFALVILFIWLVFVSFDCLFIVYLICVDDLLSVLLLFVCLLRFVCYCVSFLLMFTLLFVMFTVEFIYVGLRVDWFCWFLDCLPNWFACCVLFSFPLGLLVCLVLSLWAIGLRLG